ncbi:MAG: histidine kinase [Chloroflexi bacterium]|nr:histidine kinase [Chloroflexota bacterium]
METVRSEGIRGDVAAQSHLWKNGKPLHLICTVADFFAVAIENARLHRNLRDRERQVALLLRATIDAQELERQRICLEVHDGVAQTLAAASHYLEALDGHPALAGKLLDYVRNAAELVHRAVREAREVISTLRPAALDTLGVVETLRSEMADIRDRMGLHLYFQADVVRLPSEIETTLYRIVHEAVNNVIKHARACNVIIHIRKTGGHVVLSIEDDGRTIYSWMLSRWMLCR